MIRLYIGCDVQDSSDILCVIVAYHRTFKHLAPDHLQLTLLIWDTESVLALNKKTEGELEISVFYLVPKHFRCHN